MFSLIIAVSAGAATGLALYFTDTFGYGWSIFFGVLGFGAVQISIGVFRQKKVKLAMKAVESVLLEGQKAVQAKTMRWQTRPPGSMQEAQNELARDQRKFVAEALALTEPLHRFDNWVPMMKRQIATAQFQLYWMIKEYRKCDQLMDKVLFVEPTMYAMKMARWHVLGKTTDEITTPFGIRTISWPCHRKDGDGRFFLNGKPYPIKGVLMHRDRALSGMAVTEREVLEDVEFACEMGANAIRVVGGAHHPSFYRICNNLGVLVICDLPLMGATTLNGKGFFDTPEFRENGNTQLHEMIYHNYNHPSVVMWGIFSLIWERGDKVVEYVKSLNATAKRLDPSRPTVACSNQNGDINFITDLIVWQQNLGWQHGSVSDLAIWRQKLYDEWKHLKSAVAYGESGSIDQQTDEKQKPARIADRWLPERWHTEFHEGYAKHIAPDSIFWGVWINDMFDFGSSRYTYGISHRGLVTFDRKDKKDAYYLYRSLWNKKTPTLHISNKRHNIRQDSVQVVKFYSSAPQKPLLIVNKDTVATREYAPCQFISDTIIMHGTNRIKVTAGDLTDEQKQQMSRENAEQMLNAVMQDEREIQEKLNKMQQQHGKTLDKDW